MHDIMGHANRFYPTYSSYVKVLFIIPSRFISILIKWGLVDFTAMDNPPRPLNVCNVMTNLVNQFKITTPRTLEMDQGEGTNILCLISPPPLPPFFILLPFFIPRPHSPPPPPPPQSVCPSSAISWRQKMRKVSEMSECPKVVSYNLTT